MTENDTTPNTTPKIAPPRPDDSLSAVATRLGPAGVLAAVWLLLPALGGFALLASVGPVSEWLRTQGGAGPVIYSAVFVVAAGIGLLPTYSQAFLGGWAFGPFVGTAAAMAGFVGASTIGYVIAKRAGRDRVEREIDRHEKWRIVRDALVRSGPIKTLGIVTLVRIPPNSPFSLTNLVLATNGVPLWSYLIGTAIGMLPRTAVVVWVASQIEGQLNSDVIKEARPAWLFWGGLAVAVVVFVLLFEIGKRALAHATRSVVDAAPPTSATDGTRTVGTPTNSTPDSGQPRDA